MKKLIYPVLFMFAIVIPLIQADDYKVLNACPTDIPFVKRLFSTCKLADGECNDGEWLIINRDCKLDENIFYQMWFLRILLLISIFLLIKKNRYFPISVILLIALFFINGALY